jgi:glycosyltransferase involved in cell wall biosynthesis
MRIAFDYQTFVNQPYGGISRYFVCLAKGLHDLNNDVRIFAPLHRNNYVEMLPSNVFFGRYISKFPPKTGRIIGLYNKVRSKRKIVAFNPDIVHETYYSRVGTAIESSKTVITVYDMIHEKFPEYFAINDKTSKVKEEAIARADHVIAISESTKADLIEIFGTEPSKIAVVYLGFGAPTKTRDNLDRAKRNDRDYILYVGSRGGYKNFSGFIEAVSQSEKLVSDLDVVAFGGGAFTQLEIAQFRALGFKENQIRNVSGSDELLSQYYSEAKAFIYPSLYEGFGIPPLEAMAHDCPVVSSNTSSMPEVIGDAAEYFSPTDVGSMTRALENVMYSDARIADLQKLGKLRIKEFTWERCAIETLRVYQAVLQDKK